MTLFVNSTFLIANSTKATKISQNIKPLSAFDFSTDTGCRPGIDRIGEELALSPKSAVPKVSKPHNISNHKEHKGHKVSFT